MAQAMCEGVERRRLPRLQLTGAALLASRQDPGRALTAVLDNVNRLGAGFHAREPVEANEPVAVSLVFLNQDGEEEKERVTGRVAWIKGYERGFLIGVMWDNPVSKATNVHLALYLEETAQQ